MKFPPIFRAGLLAVAISCSAPVLPASAGEAAPAPATHRDGQHDFDFNIGVWKTHIRRILDPLSGTGIHRKPDPEKTMNVLHHVKNPYGAHFPCFPPGGHSDIVRFC